MATQNSSLPIYNMEGKEVEQLKLDALFSSQKVNTAVLHQAVIAYLANQRKGLAATKTRGEVSGGGRKPWKQKGTGRARVGSIRSPLWRHGGVIFGPHPRDFSYRLPQKIKLAALREAVSLKLKENNLIVLEGLKLETAKTKEGLRVFANLKLLPAKRTKSYKILLLLDKIDANLKRSLDNIAFLNTGLASDAHAYQIMAHQKLLITRGGLEQLVKRIKK